MKGIEDRIAKSIIARSQIVKKCFVNGKQCDFHVEESSFVQDGGYTCSELEKDIDGFIEDVNREVSMFGLQCGRSNVRFGISNDLLVFAYDQKAVAVSEDAMERIRTSEWIIEE
jgi:hypothetical protein